ncbi:MAG: magnesium-protoporphyrin IX monomethyl ester oxidative cyclase, partial [Candidatus Mariimomonas ferrooxydans]
LAKEYNPDFMHFLLIAPWPYADIYEELKPFVEVYDYSRYNLVYPIVKPSAMTRDELFKHVLKCYKNYYTWKIEEWLLLKPGLKRDCIFKGIKAIMENFFLKDHMGKHGLDMKGAPKAVRDILGAGLDAS